MTSDYQLISTDLLKTKFQLRVAGLEQELVQEYAEAMADGYGAFPPVAVAKIDGEYFVIDGHHRLEAARRNGIEEVPCQTVTNDRDTALFQAFARNTKQGLRFSKADREHAICLMLKEFWDRSDRWIAAHIGVNNSTISRHRNRMLEEQASASDSGVANATANNQTETRKGADGKEYPAKTRPAVEYEPEPEPDVTDEPETPVDPPATVSIPETQPKKSIPLCDAKELTLSKDLEAAIVAAKLWSFFDGNANPSKIHDIASTLEDRLING